MRRPPAPVGQPVLGRQLRQRRTPASAAPAKTVSLLPRSAQVMASPPTPDESPIQSAQTTPTQPPQNDEGTTERTTSTPVSPGGAQPLEVHHDDGGNRNGKDDDDEDFPEPFPTPSPPRTPPQKPSPIVSPQPAVGDDSAGVLIQKVRSILLCFSSNVVSKMCRHFFQFKCAIHIFK
jgi:hypothetical protein